MDITKDNYQQDLLDKHELLLVEFFGSWCTPCKMQAGILDKLEEHYGGKLKVVKLDIDTHEDLAKIHSVMTVPTMIIYKSGQEADRMVGFRQQKQISEKVDAFL